MSNFILYARKSTESEDRQALSIEAQVAELSEYARKNEINIIRTFRESKSAKVAGRPVFNEMLAQLRRVKPTGVLCWKLDRLTRNLADAALISDLMESGTIQEIRTPVQTYRNTSGDKFMTGLDFIMAKKFIDELSENVKRGLRAKVAQGWRPGRAPIGYVQAPDREKGYKIIVPDTDRFKMVRQMWDLMLTGSYSGRQIVRLANDTWGFRTRKTRTMGGLPLTQSMLYDMFHDPFYYGQFRYQGQLHEGRHKPMVTRGEFDRVQEIIARKGNTRARRLSFAYTGMIRCGECGAMVTAELKKKYIRGERRTRQYIYYHCTHKKKPGCAQRSITEEALEEQVDRFLSSIEVPQAYLDWAIKHIDKATEDERKEEEARESRKRQEIRRLETQLDNLIGLKISPENAGGRLLGDEEFVRQKETILLQKSRLESIVGRRDNLSDRASKLAKETFEFGAFARIWFANGDSQQKRDILAAIGSNHVLKDGILLMSAKEPLQVLTSTALGPGGKMRRLEPPDFGLECTKSTSLGSGFRANLRRAVNVRTEIRKLLENGEDYHVYRGSGSQPDA